MTGKNGTSLEENAIHNPSSAQLPNAATNETHQVENKKAGAAPYRVLVISDTYPGTKAFSKDNFVGLAEYFNSGGEKKADAIIVFGGYTGLIPWIPPYEQQNQLKSIEEGINFLSSASAVVKPAFERLFNVAAAPNAEIYAVPGMADSQNIDVLERELRRARRYKPEWFQDELVRTRVKLDDTREIIKSVKATLASYEKRLARHPNDASLISEYENTKKKLRLNEEEYAEYKEKKKMLKILYNAHIESLSFEKLTNLTNRLKKEMEELVEKTKRLPNENGTKAEHDSLVIKKKAVANLLRAANKRIEELGNLELESIGTRGTALIEVFTHNVQIKPDIEKIVYRLAKADYKSIIKDIDRKSSIIIPDKDLTFVQKKLNGFEFTMAIKSMPTIGTSSRMYNKNSNTAVADNFYTYIETSGKRELLQKPLTMLISGGHIFTSFSMEPTFDLDRQKIFLSLAKGPFADRAEIAETLNNKIVTRTNKAVEKLPFDSSASIIDVFPNGEIKHTLLTSEFLKIKRIEADKRELAIAKRLIDEKKQNKQKAQEHPAGGTDIGGEVAQLKDKMLEALRIQQRLPSELRTAEVPNLSTTQILKLIPHAIETLPKNIKKLGVVAFSDVHWGGWAEVDLLEKSVELGKKYIHELDASRTPILLLNGDIIEGNLANFKNSPAQLIDPKTNGKYREYLKEHGFTEEQINARMVKHMENISIIQTISAQAGSAVIKLVPIIDEVMSKGGSIIVVSGNHFNNTDRTHAHDEATEISDKIMFYLAGRGFGEDYIDDHIKVVTGEEYGIGNIPIDGDNVIRTQHKLARVLEQKPQAVVRKRIPVAAVFESHYHEPKQTASGDVQTFETPAMQYEDENTYVSEFPQAISDATRGFAIVEVDLKDNKTIKSTYEPIVRANLERNGELETSLYHAFRNETFSIKTVKNEQTKKLTA